MQSKKEQLKKFGIIIKNRRQSLGYTMRELSVVSNVSPALIAKLENAQMPNFPRRLTIEQLSSALKFENNELFILANMLDNLSVKQKAQTDPYEELRELLAIKMNLNPKNLSLALYFIKGLQKLQEIDELKG